MKRRKTDDFPLGTPLIRQRADPYMYRHKDGTYYFTASVPEYDKIILRESDTITGLQTAKEYVIWEKHRSGEQGGFIWAPELHYLNGSWYLYYAASDSENVWNIRPYLLKCTGNDPQKDPWQELGRLKGSVEDPYVFNNFSLDATVFQHKNQDYLVWAEKRGKSRQTSNLYLSKMETPWKLAGKHVLLSTPDYEWERKGIWVNEGPAVLKHEDSIFLTYSASDTGRNYCMGMLSVGGEADVMDPKAWKKSPIPIMETDEKRGIYGPGHNSFVKGEDGETDYCIFHAREYGEIKGDPLFDPNRHTMAMKVKWRNNVPLFSYED